MRKEAKSNLDFILIWIIVDYWYFFVRTYKRILTTINKLLIIFDIFCFNVICTIGSKALFHKYSSTISFRIIIRNRNCNYMRWDWFAIYNSQWQPSKPSRSQSPYNMYRLDNYIEVKRRHIGYHLLRESYSSPVTIATFFRDRIFIAIFQLSISTYREKKIKIEKNKGENR